MAAKNVTVVTDDLTGKPLSPNAHEHVTFSLDGVAYELDVSAKTAQMLRAVFAPYIRAGRRLPRRRRAASKTAVAPDASAVRAWARGQGLDVSERGRVPAHVVAQYEAAQP